MSVSTYERNGFTVEIFHDEVTENPRKEYDYLGEIITLKSRYLLGDREVEKEEIEETTNDDRYFTLPVYAHIHGTVSLSTGGFADPFDSGQCGIIYVSRDKAKENWPLLGGDMLEEAVIESLESEVEEFSNYLSGNVYGYSITGPIGEVDCECGFFGIESVEEAANSAADNAVIPVPCEMDITTCVGVCESASI